MTATALLQDRVDICFETDCRFAGTSLATLPTCTLVIAATTVVVASLDIDTGCSASHYVLRNALAVADFLVGGAGTFTRSAGRARRTNSPTTSTVCSVACGVDTFTTTELLSCWTFACTRLTGLSVTASIATFATVIWAGVWIKAAIVAFDLIALATALTRSTDLIVFASSSTTSTVCSIACGIDTFATTELLTCWTLARTGLTSLSRFTYHSTCSTVFGVCHQVYTRTATVIRCCACTS